MKKEGGGDWQVHNGHHDLRGIMMYTMDRATLPPLPLSMRRAEGGGWLLTDERSQRLEDWPWSAFCPAELKEMFFRHDLNCDGSWRRHAVSPAQAAAAQLQVTVISKCWKSICMSWDKSQKWRDYCHMPDYWDGSCRDLLYRMACQNQRNCHLPHKDSTDSSAYRCTFFCTLFKFILFIEPKYCKHISDHTIFIIFSFHISEYILLNIHML